MTIAGLRTRIERAERRATCVLSVSEGALSDAGLPWQEWLRKHFSDICIYPFAERHVNLWNWFDSLTPHTDPPAARVEVWPRSGAKSSTGELGVTRLCEKLTRRYVLYVCGTQHQSDQHVGSIAHWLERRGVARAINQYGHSRGWQRQELRTGNGFNVSGFGLDAGLRGAKLDNWRPDLIIFDDIDEQHDTPETVAKKITTITTAILPAGSPDVAVLFLQNKIHEEGIVASLCDGRADFLHNRTVFEEPAVIGLSYETVQMQDGGRRYVITGGTPTWAGQDLRVCERQLNEWGERAFLREAQHEVEGAEGVFFRVSELRSVPPDALPRLVAVSLAWDLAATEGGGDYTVGVLMGRAANGTYYILAVIRGQWSSERVRGCITLACAHYLPQYSNPVFRLPQDPGQAGKDQKQQLATLYRHWNPKIEPVTGSKATRAEGLQEELNKGNVTLVETDLPDIFSPYLFTHSWRQWHFAFREELRKFREDEQHERDDQVDAAADGFNALKAPDRRAQSVTYQTRA